MRGLKNYNLFLILLVLLFGFCIYAAETEEIKVEIKSYYPEIKVGEPLILEIKATYKTPQIDSKSGESETKRGIRAPYLIFAKKGNEKEFEYKSELYMLDRYLPIYDKEKKGLEYTGSLFVFYDFMKRELFFEEPNEYTCRLESSGDKLKSNTIKINIKPAGKLEEKAMSILTDKFDIAILGMPSLDIDLKNSESKGIIDRYIQVVDQCKQTKIANMAAAMLGLQYFKNFHEAHPSFEKFREKYKSGNIQEPLFEQSQKYLTIASHLPDEFPIRPAVLLQLSRIEFMKDNFNGMISLIKELTEKYPNTQYGQKAIRALKEEFPKIKEQIDN